MPELEIPCRCDCGHFITDPFDYHTQMIKGKIKSSCSQCAPKACALKGGVPVPAEAEGANTTRLECVGTKEGAEGQDSALTATSPPSLGEIIWARPQGISSPKPIDLPETQDRAVSRLFLTPSEENELHTRQLLERVEHTFIEIGRLLWENRQNAYWSARWDTFEDYLEDLNLKKSHAYALIGVYETFQAIGSPHRLEPQELLEIGTTKAQRLLPVARAGRLTPELLETAKATPTIRELDRLLQKIPDKEGEMILHCHNCGEAILTCPRCKARILKAVWKREVKGERE